MSGDLDSDIAAHLRRAAALFLLHTSLYGDCKLPDHGEQLLEIHTSVPIFREQCAGAGRGTGEPPELPGIGAEIKPELLKNGDASVVTVAKS